jgi:hypothetical protein
MVDMRMANSTSEFNDSACSVKARCVRGVTLLAGAVAFLCCALLAQPPDSKTSNANQSWTTSHDSHTDVDSQHTVESHTKNGNRTIDRRTTERRQADGYVSDYQEVETESVQVDPSTVRTTTRTFGPNGSGGKTLVQVTEEETQTLPGGGSKSVRSTKNLDVSGNLQMAQREVSETKKVSGDAEVTKTTVLLPSVNGGFAPATQIEERKQKVGNNTEFQKTTRLLDGGGNWQVSEVRKGTIKEEGKNRTTEEHVSRGDTLGNFGEVRRTVTKESESPSGEKRKTVENYSIDVPGSARDGSLHMVQRDTTTQSASSSGQQTTVQQLEQPNPGDLSSGMQVITITKDAVRTGPSGTQATRTVQVRNGSGSYDVVSVDTSKSDNTHAVQVQIAPSNKPPEKKGDKSK